MKIFIDSNLLIYLNALKSFELRKNYEDFYISLLSNYKAYVEILPLSKMEYKKAFEILKISNVKTLRCFTYCSNDKE